jgi:hypothetical protein
MTIKEQIADNQNNFNAVSFILDYEMGQIETAEEIVQGFQGLIDTGMINFLKNKYWEKAVELIDAGLCRI